jgi:hypothetical protein
MTGDFITEGESITAELRHINERLRALIETRVRPWAQRHAEWNGAGDDLATDAADSLRVADVEDEMLGEMAEIEDMASFAVRDLINSERYT